MYLLKEIELIIHTNLYYKLLKKYKSHFTVFFDYSFDTLGHIYWRNLDEYSKYPDVLPNAYKIFDNFLGKVKSFAEKNDYHLIICSDHGFEEIEKKHRKNFRTIKVLYLLRELKFYYDVYGIYMTYTVVFRMRPDSSRPITDFKKAMESITCDGKPLFNIKPYSNKLIVRINEFFGDKRNLKVELPNGKKLNLDEILDFNPGHTGDHSANHGVFIIQGSRIKKSKKIKDITPYDIAPTILSLFGESIPSEMDGRVLKEIFNI